MDKELLVMQAGGASRGQLARPALWLGAILFLYLLFSSHILEPWANQQFKNKQFSFRNDLASLVVKEDSFNTLIPNLTIYVERTNNNVLYNLILHDNRMPEKTYTVFAKKGEFVQTQKGLSVALAQGSLQENKNGEIVYGDFKNFTVDLGVLEEKKERRVKPKELFSTTLLSPPEKTDQPTRHKYKSEFHRRNLVATWPMLSICLALMGLFLGSITGRTKGKNILITSIIFVGFEALLLTSINLLKKNVALAGAMYGMHALFLIAGLAFLWSTRGKKK